MVLFVEKKSKKIEKYQKSKKKFKFKIIYEQLHRVNVMVVQVKLGNYKKVDKKKFEKAISTEREKLMKIISTKMVPSSCFYVVFFLNIFILL